LPPAVKLGDTVPGEGQLLGQAVGLLAVTSPATGNVVSGVAPRFSSPNVMLVFGAATQPFKQLGNGLQLGVAGGLAVNETGTVVLFHHAGTVGTVFHSG
jgi:hypothetical protein